MARTTTLKEMGEMLAHIVGNMATKDDIRNMATKDDIRNMATKDDIRNMATKDDIARLDSSISDMGRRLSAVERGQDEILAELKPLSRAHDKDSVTIVDHERRIARLEERQAA